MRHPLATILLTAVFSLAVVPALSAGESVSGTISTADWIGDSDAGSQIVQTQLGAFAAPFARRSNFAADSAANQGSIQRNRTSRLLATAPTGRRQRRLSRSPSMLGDTFTPPLQLITQIQGDNRQNLVSITQLPAAGGAAHIKISENNRPIPVDRIFVNYNHFHNAARSDVFSTGGSTPEFITQRQSVDRYTVGFEKTILDGSASVEFRLPLSNYPELNSVNAGSSGQDVITSTGTAGNLSVITKFLLVDADDYLFSGGLGVETPTGADSSFRNSQSLFVTENEAVLLHPFVAMMFDGDSRSVSSFLQLDIPLNGNTFSSHNLDGIGSLGRIGSLQSQTILHWDTTFSQWLFRNDSDSLVTGVAALAEFHLVSALDSPRQIAAVQDGSGAPTDVLLSSSAGQFLATYITTGVHLELARNFAIRIGSVFPLASGVDRFFDAEINVQLERRY